MAVILSTIPVVKDVLRDYKTQWFLYTDFTEVTADL